MTDGTDAVAPSARDPTDAELVARARDDDPMAFEALVRRHYRAAFAVALAVLTNRADAEDVCHDALVRALARLEECRQPDRFAKWLCAIVRNLARNALVTPAARLASALDPRTPALAPPPSHLAELDDLRTTLEAALALLSPVQREVVFLHDLHDWSHDEIAESIGTSAGMSRQHLFKARRRLRETLGADLLKEHFND